MPHVQPVGQVKLKSNGTPRALVGRRSKPSTHVAKITWQGLVNGGKRTTTGIVEVQCPAYSHCNSIM